MAVRMIVKLEDITGLQLSPGADDALEPLPRLRVQRLACAADDAQRAEVVLLHGRVPEAHERADCGRRRVKLRDLVALDDVPVPARVRIEWRALEHERRGAVAQRSIHDVGVTCNPSNICSAPKNILFLILENIFKSESCVNHIPSSCVHHSLRFTRRPRGIQNEKWIFRIHHFGFTLIR
jgi:hypothetical protein